MVRLSLSASVRELIIGARADAVKAAESAERLLGI
jgi:hypothetical protein